MASIKSIEYKKPKHFISQKDGATICPKCEIRTVNSFVIIPVINGKIEVVYGRRCGKCDAFYVEDENRVRSLLVGNPLTKGYTLDGKELGGYSHNERLHKEENKVEKRGIKQISVFKNPEEQGRILTNSEKERRRDLFGEKRKERFSALPSAEVMVCVQFVNGKSAEYIIVTKKEDENNKDTFLYSSTIGRELLSAAFAGERNKSGVIDGQRYDVVWLFYPNNKRKQLSKGLILDELLIRKDGGYYSSVKNNQREIVETLLYSLRNQRYEIIRATYDKWKEECFVDISRYRDYVDKYGKASLMPDFDRSTSFEMRHFDDLNSESVLMGYGYSVSKKEGLSPGERREILAEIVDLEILTVKRVVGLIEFFIQTHSNDYYYEARIKWEADKRFIQDYKVNPERFLILSR